MNPVAIARRQSRRANVQKRDWAYEVDVNKSMRNFHELVPEMAHKVGAAWSDDPSRADCGPTVSIRAGHVPEGGGVPSRDGRLCVRRSPHIGGEDSGGRVCHRARGETYDKVHASTTHLLLAIGDR